MAFGRRREPARTGQKAPDFTMPRLDGGEASLSEIAANGPALLAFFKVSCPVCQLTFPFLERIYASGRMPVYGISQNDPQATGDFTRKYGLSFPTLLDEQRKGFPVSNAFGISTVPTLFLVERDGTISHVIEGWLKEDVGRLAALAGVPLFGAGESNVPEWKAG